MSKIEWTHRQGSKVTLAYLAGVIDSDGYITIQRTKKTKVLSSGNGETIGIYHCLKVGIAGTDKTVHALAKKVSGGGTVSRYVPKDSHHLIQYQWSVSNEIARLFLIKLRPYLLLKRRQCDIGIKFHECFKEQRDNTVFSWRITSKVRAQRDKFWSAVVKLNKSRRRLRSTTNAN